MSRAPTTDARKNWQVKGGSVALDCTVGGRTELLEAGFAVAFCAELQRAADKDLGPLLPRSGRATSAKIVVTVTSSTRADVTIEKIDGIAGNQPATTTIQSSDRSLSAKSSRSLIRPIAKELGLL